MNVVFLALGVALLAGTIVDLLWTTLWVEGGAGPLMSRLMPALWRGLRRIGNRNSRVLSLAGPLILVAGLAMWIGFLWAGWTFVFAGSEIALVDTRDGGPISWSERVYYIGYTIFTLGNGDFAPRDGMWQIATALATATGMLFVTLSVTYILSVLDAVTQKRAFASNVSGLGLRGETIVETGWDGETFRGLELALNTFTSQLNTLTTNHKAYPVLHYFHSEQDEQAPVISISVLDEALTLVRFGIVEEDRPSKVIVNNARSSVQSYLDTLSRTFIYPAEEPPPPPDLQTIRDVGAQTVSDEAFADSLANLTERRQTLLGLVESDGRQWPRREGE